MTRLAAAAVLLLPFLVCCSRTSAEIVVGGIDALFLIRCATSGRWAWLRTPWVIIAGAWWGWTILCSVPLPGLGFGAIGAGPLVQALVLGRFFLFAAALGEWLLRDRRLRQALFVTLAIVAGGIVLECWQQYLFGTNIFGWPRANDGALTGPFWEPRAGPQLVLILFPAVLPVTVDLLARPERWRRALGIAVFALVVATVVLIGQRMPALLTGLGLICCALILPRLRPVALAAAAIATCVLVATPIVSPPTFYKLVLHFAEQMRHFEQSDYGQLYIKAAAIGMRHPLFGLGFDGFRTHCQLPGYANGIPALGLVNTGSVGGCNIHPHNHYLEAFTAGGVPGLLLFVGLSVAWLTTLARGLGSAPAAQVGCFIAVVLALWPVASSSAFFTLPNAGWFFLVLGAGLALAPARHYRTRPAAAAGYALPAGD